MRRILIFGNSGSGKSTMAKKLVETEGLGLLALDMLAWLPEKPPRRMSLLESKKKIEAFIMAHDGWVIEGCYTDLLECAAPYATEVMFMNLSVGDCVENAKARAWEPLKYESKQAQDENLEMLLAWIKQYPERKDLFFYDFHLRLFQDFVG